ncbi:glutathione peroxidase [Fructilactobacillus hinvesii]|uniref:Glutathione peroxidase n=1 Tax=Fructilactobacillus hinvesii TaxID=2940300 RepID=A0ABY5BWZ3_9LACO|nr:glutathione peroxidase [Fructilactobacillus hinvesii]USS88506.1 glutathione peroxidase [Fructilactobacillus hinvesii]
MLNSVYDYKTKELNGDSIDFADFKGKVILVVNTASKCGLAGQLKDLEKLYKKYHDQGLEVIGFPSNQFLMELKDSKNITEYCQVHYGVTFPITQTIKVNGEDTDPLFAYLKKESGHGPLKWNYTKFLIGKDGKLIHRYAPITNPEKLEPEIQRALQA